MNPANRTLFVLIRSLANGGAEKQSILLTQALNSAHRASLVVLSETPLLEKHVKAASQAGIEVIFLKGSLFQKISQFRALVRARKAEVLFAHLPSDTFFAAVAGRLAGVPYIFGGLRNAWVSRSKLILMRLAHNRLLNYSISNSWAGKRYLDVNGFKPEKTLVLPNGIVITEPLRERRPQPGSPAQIISVGRFVPQKDFRNAIAAMSRLRQFPGIPPFHYHLVGYGEQEAEIRQWIAEFQVQDLVTVHINPPNLPDLYRQSDIYLCSSIFEGVSNTVMEAMMYSLPAVATRVGDNDQLVIDHETGLLTNPGEPDGMAFQLSQLLMNPELRLTYGKAAYERLSKLYSYETFRQNYLTLIQTKAPARA
jgi:glycosyltransferase involved in cell wall biosynthesis